MGQNKTHNLCGDTGTDSNRKKSNYYKKKGLSWSWSYGSWINNYLCNQCLSPLTL